MWISKKKYKALKTLAITNNALLIGLIDEMHNRDAINGDNIAKNYKEIYEEIGKILKEVGA